MCSIPRDEATSGSANNRVTVPPMLLGSIVALIVATLWRTIPSTAAFMATIGMMAAGVIVFLVAVALFVHTYTGPYMRKACAPAGHISALVKKQPPSKASLADLDRITNPEGLTQLWKEEIQANEKNFKILLTGVTGYVGRAFLFQLLREIAEAEENGQKTQPHKVYVMARGKPRRNLTAADRLQTIRDEPMFAVYKKQWDDVVVAAQSGDLQEDKCGMSKETVQMLADAQLTHVVHCAADVNFNRPLPDSAGINISPALQLQALAAEWPSCSRFVHCSTAFVHPVTGSDEEPIPESLFSLGKYDPQDLYDSMRGDQKLALQVKKEFGFPNNYVLTKCVAEHLVVRHNDSTKMELRICRPAIVGPAWLLPEQGWNGDKPSTISGVFLLWGTRVVRFGPLINKPMPVVPVDVVAAAIIHAMIAPPVEKKNGCFPASFRNLIWSHASPKSFIGGTSLAKKSVKTATLLRHFSTTETALSLFLLDIVARYPSLFGPLHTVFNLGPLYLLQFVCWSVKLTGIKTVLDQVPVVKLFKFSDMLMLYKPYMGRDFKFASSLNMPESCNMEAYCASLMVATQNFWTKMFPGTIQALDELDLLPTGRLDLWWAMTQPSSSFANRFVGYLACKILRASCTNASVDWTSVEEVFATMVNLEETICDQKHCVVLAPNHKSAMDFILVKYVAFYLASMGIDIPQVLSQNEFNDAELTEKLNKGKSQFDRHIAVAAFLEGTPSTDGRLGKPNSGALKKIVDMDGTLDYTVVPMSMGYKSTTDSEVLLQATKSCSDIGLAEMLSLYWQICVVKKTKPACLGDVKVAFGVPSALQSDADLDAAAANLHSELNRLANRSS